jgi:hypothetical protein
VAEHWRPGGFQVSTDQGTAEVAGWLHGHFALDFRLFRDEWGDWSERGWQLTHVPTGMVAAGILAPLDRACEIADEIAAAADWDFTDPSEARSRGPAAMAVIAAHEGVAIRTTGRGPLFKSAMVPA